MFRVAFFLLALFVPALCVAQRTAAAKPASAAGKPVSAPANDGAKLASINIVGSKRFAERDIVTATGLQIGNTVTPADFKAAADRLVATGAFSEVAFAYTPTRVAYALSFDVRDAESLFPVQYANFIWFKRDELDAAIHARIPLYSGVVPATGAMLDNAIGALQGFLTTHGINGTVNFRLHADGLGKAIKAIVFTVEGIPMKLTEIAFPGSATEEKTLRDTAQRLLNAEYDESVVDGFAAQTLVPALQKHGYLQAQFGAPAVQTAGEDKAGTRVKVTLPVELGPQYRLQHIDFAGNSAFATDQIRKMLHVNDGAIADGPQIQAELGAVREMYSSKGFLHVKFAAEREMDAATSLVKYHVKVDEGDVYRMGTLTIEGVDAGAQKSLAKKWKLREGDPYDATYFRKFVNESAGVLQRAVVVVPIVKERPGEKVVDVTMRFSLR